MGMLPMANSCIAAVPADVKAARIPLPTPIPQLATRKSCMPIKNAAACVASPAPLASLAPPSPVGSKKRSSASCFVYNPARPGSRRSHVHDPRTGRALVVCAQKSQRLLDVDCSVPPDAASGGVCGRGSQQKDVSAVVGGHSREVSPVPVLYGLFERVDVCDPRRTTLRCRQRDGRNRPCRALE